MSFDIRTLNLKDFKITLEDGLVLTLKSPKMKVMRKLMREANQIGNIGDTDMSDDDFDAIISLVGMILNSNYEDKKLSNDYIEENFDANQIIEFTGKYMEWLTGLHKAKN